MKQFIIVLSALIANSSFSQVSYISQCSKEVIKKNKIYKCIEYNILDSVDFFRDFPNGNYMIFDDNGYGIEQNSYTESSNPRLRTEFKVYYLYDNHGKEIMWLWYDTNSLSKVTRVVTNKYDSLGKLIGSNDFAPYNRYNPSDYGDNSNRLQDDSVIFKKGKVTQITYYGFYGKGRKDTVYKRIRYYTSNRFDSATFRAHREHWCKVSTLHYKYNDTTLTEIISKEDCDMDNHPTIRRVLYSKNGLPNRVYTTYWDEKTKSEGKSEVGFKYYYWH